MKFYLVLLCLVPLGNSWPVSEKNVCIAKYLRTKGFEAGSSDGTLSSKCEAVVNEVKEATVNESFSHVFDDSSEDESTKTLETCIRKGFKDNPGVVDIFLAADFYESNGKPLKMVELLQANGTALVIEIIITCRVSQILDEKEKIIPNEALSVRKWNLSEKYCMRKHVVDNNLLSIANLTLDINPENIDTSNVECNILFPEVAKKFGAAWLEREGIEDTTCFLDVFHEENFIDRVLQFEFTRELNLNDENKIEFRNELVKFNMNWALKATKCLSL